MRELPWTAEFDRVVNWFTAFGYFADDDNRRVLGQIASVLEPGGVAALDLMNRDWLARNFQPHGVAERDGNFMIDRRRLDAVAGTVNTERIVIHGEHRRQFRFFVRLFTYTELRDWLLTAGFARVDGHGDRGEPLTLDSQRLIVTAQR